MAACCAYGCGNRFSKKAHGVTFHRFPENPDLRDAWVSAVQRKDWQPSRSTRICSEHFSEDQIDRTSYFRVRLRDNAVPNVFKACRPHGKKKGEREKNPENEQSIPGYCKIAMRPTKTAPLVISLKPANAASDSMKTTLTTTPSPSSNLVTAPVSSCSSETSAAATLTTALPTISLFPQLLPVSCAPIITSSIPSIIATNIGNFLTTALPQTVTLPIIPSLGPPLTASINLPQPVICKENKDVVINGSAAVPAVSPQERNIIQKLQYKNKEYCRKIQTLQQRVRRQRCLIERLTTTIRAMKGGKEFGDYFLTECLISNGSECDSDYTENPEELSAVELTGMSIKTEVNADCQQSDELNFEDDDLNFKDALNFKEEYDELGMTEDESCTELLSRTIKTEFRTTSPDAILP